MPADRPAAASRCGSLYPGGHGEERECVREAGHPGFHTYGDPSSGDGQTAWDDHAATNSGRFPEEPNVDDAPSRATTPSGSSGERSAALSIREQAIATVDYRHGYTYEFSNTPHRHLDEYDEEEKRLNLTRVWCRAGVVRLGGSRDGCQWAGYRMLASATAKPCPRCGSEVVRV